MRSSLGLLQPRQARQLGAVLLPPVHRDVLPVRRQDVRCGEDGPGDAIHGCVVGARNAPDQVAALAALAALAKAHLGSEEC